MRKKVLCVVLAILICNFGLFSYADNKTSNLQEEHNELKTKIEESNNELKGVQDELSDNLQQVQEIDQKIESTQEELNKTNEKITELTKTIKKTEKDLKIAKNNYDKERKLSEERIIAMYEAGDTEYLDVLLKSNGITEFLSNYYLLEEITANDVEMLENLDSKRQEVEKIQENLKLQKAEVVDVKKSQLKTATILKNTKALRESYISKLSEQEKEIQSKIDEYTKRFAEINSEILSLSSNYNISSEYIGGELAWPVPGYTYISSPYGMRTHPITGVYKLHTGVDIGNAPMGANFVAANDGVVVKAEFNKAYGNMVIIDHGGGISTLYAHGSQIVTSLGAIVKRGDVVLKVGSTGYSTGPHAHFEVRKNGVTVDPMPYITKGVIPNKETNEQTNNNQN